MAMATGSSGSCMAFSIMACMAAWICVKLREGLSGIGLSFLVPCAVNTQRVPHAVNEPGKPGSTPPNWRGNCRAQHLALPYVLVHPLARPSRHVNVALG